MPNQTRVRFPCLIRPLIVPNQTPKPIGYAFSFYLYL